MKNNIWAKTLLKSYNHFEKIVETIDGLVEKSIASSYYNSTANIEEEFEKQANHIIDFIERKKLIINMKVLIDLALKNCKKLNREILTERYFENLTGDKIAQKHNFAMRTYFRRLESAEEELCENFALLGYDNLKLENVLANESWIKEIYNFFAKKDENEEIFDKKDCEKLFFEHAQPREKVYKRCQQMLREQVNNIKSGNSLTKEEGFSLEKKLTENYEKNLKEIASC